MGSDNLDDLGKKFKKLRLKAGLTQEMVAEKAGLDYKHYQSIEGGRKKDLKLKTIKKLAEAFDLKPHELVKILFTEKRNS